MPHDTPVGPWRWLVRRCTPPSPTAADCAIAEVYAVFLAGGTPLLVAFIVADAIRGFRDVSYWREIPVDLSTFLALAVLALQPQLPRAVRGFGITVPLTIVSISDQVHAGAGGLGPVVLVINTGILSLWHRRGPAIGTLLSVLSIAGPRLFATPSAARSGGAASPQSLLLGLGATVICGIALGRGIRGLAETAS